MLMNNVGDFEYKMRRMDLKLRTINKKLSKPKRIEIKSILKIKGVPVKKGRDKLRVGFDLKKNNSFY